MKKINIGTMKMLDYCDLEKSGFLCISGFSLKDNKIISEDNMPDYAVLGDACINNDDLIFLFNSLKKVKSEHWVVLGVSNKETIESYSRDFGGVKYLTFELEREYVNEKIKLILSKYKLLDLFESNKSASISVSFARNNKLS